MVYLGMVGKKRFPLLYVAKVRQHFLVDVDDPVESLFTESLMPKFGSGITFNSYIKASWVRYILSQIATKYQQVIVGPLKVIPKRRDLMAYKIAENYQYVKSHKWSSKTNGFRFIINICVTIAKLTCNIFLLTLEYLQHLGFSFMISIYWSILIILIPLKTYKSSFPENKCNLHKTMYAGANLDQKSVRLSDSALFFEK